MIMANELARSPALRNYLLTCRYCMTSKLCLRLLRLFLGTRRDKGIHISIDQPHSYTHMALKRLGVPQEGLIYIDAISKLTGVRAESSSVRFLSDGFSLPILDDVFSRAYLPEGVERYYVKLEDLGFVLVDNVSVALQYARPEKVMMLMLGLTNLIKKYTALRAFLVMEPKSNPDVHQYLRSICDREFSFKDEWL